jgi:hypothetical protein
MYSNEISKVFNELGSIDDQAMYLKTKELDGE